jgi:hypothetical protein
MNEMSEIAPVRRQISRFLSKLILAKASGEVNLAELISEGKSVYEQAASAHIDRASTIEQFYGRLMSLYDCESPRSFQKSSIRTYFLERQAVDIQVLSRLYKERLKLNRYRGCRARQRCPAPRRFCGVLLTGG